MGLFNRKDRRNRRESPQGRRSTTEHQHNQPDAFSYLWFTSLELIARRRQGTRPRRDHERLLGGLLGRPVVGIVRRQ
jgi:hypothetical protein